MDIDNRAHRLSVDRRAFLRLAAASPLAFPFALSSLLAGCGARGGIRSVPTPVSKPTPSGAPSAQAAYRVSFLFNVASASKSEVPGRAKRRGTKRRTGRDAVSGTVAEYYSQINDRGEVAWFTFTDSSYSSSQVFLRRADGSDTFIKTVPVDNGSGAGATFALNNLSQLAFTANDFLGKTTAVSVWKDGVETPVTTLTRDWYVSSFSDSGYILIYDAEIDRPKTLLIAPDGTQIDPGVSTERVTPDSYLDFASGFYGINQALDIVGYTTSGSDGAAIIKSRSGATTPLPLPPNSGPAPEVFVNGLNDSGAAFGLIVGVGLNNNTGSQEYGYPVLWSAPNYAATFLQPLHNDDAAVSPWIEASAAAINNAGDIVGTSGYDFSIPVIWHSGTTAAIDLNTLIPPNSGWTLLNATGINNQGQIIGDGFLGGSAQSAAFLLTPVNG